MVCCLFLSGRRVSFSLSSEGSVCGRVNEAVQVKGYLEHHDLITINTLLFNVLNKNSKRMACCLCIWPMGGQILLLVLYLE
ncbi:hypothetical protein VCR17J2_790009 [Vibrio coralliirubri]|nr:hypothetical protein VCR17J2_790009 [Vibrio coralliirubri]